MIQAAAPGPSVSASDSAAPTKPDSPTPVGLPAAAFRPQKRDLTLGLVPLTDCAPIAVAVEKGFFAEVGLHVATTREQSWAGIRDKVAFGLLDGAQMLATMPLATTLGLGGFQHDFAYGLTLGLNGNAITLASWLADALEESGHPLRPDGANPADGLAELLKHRREQGEPPLRLGMVFPMSTHDLELRYWLAAAGIDPDSDVELVVVPPPRMVEALRAGELAGYCVGEPWNSVAVAEGLGQVAMTKHDLWNHSPEKVLGVTAAWAERHPQTHAAMAAALIRAGQWLDAPDHREEAASILSLPQYVGVEPGRLLPSLAGRFRVSDAEPPIDRPSFHAFHRYQANVPWRSQARWFLQQMHRWGRLDHRADAEATLDRVVRPEVYRAAASSLGLPLPDRFEKTEGTHAGPWTLPAADGDLPMGADAFFDAATFDPDATPLPRPTQAAGSGTHR
ncbi:MAG: CmpA/NrtA family ABC transporter substrate-binding protein [Planctomycetota bacterium]